jgi:hypothetical protein
MSDGVNADFRDMIMETLTSMKNTLEETLAGALSKEQEFGMKMIGVAGVLK